MARRVGVRELEDHLSDVLRSVKAGETVEITERDKPVAIILPFHAADVRGLVARLAENGALSWGGGRPTRARGGASRRGDALGSLAHRRRIPPRISGSPQCTGTPRAGGSARDLRRAVEALDSDMLAGFAGDLAERRELRGFDALQLASALRLRDLVRQPVQFACFEGAPLHLFIGAPIKRWSEQPPGPGWVAMVAQAVVRATAWAGMGSHGRPSGGPSNRLGRDG